MESVPKHSDDRVQRHVDRIFLFEIDRQARFGLFGAVQLQRALEMRSTDDVFQAIQSILIAAGNVSKLLRCGTNPERRDRLGHLLGVAGDSPIHSRGFRNHFEHFDERLEAWAKSSQDHNFVDASIMPRGAIQGIDTGDFLRILDPTTYTLDFRGEPYELRPALEALDAIRKTIAEKDLLGLKPRIQADTPAAE